MLRSDCTNGIAESSSQIFKLEKRTYVFITQKQGCKTENEPFENGADVVGEASSLSSRGLEEMLIA